MRRIVIIVGSKTDLKQCGLGLQWLKDNQSDVSVLNVYVASQHRHTLRVQEILEDLSSSANPPDAIIVGAGWANHLTGCCDAYLRYTLKNSSIKVLGVSFEDENDERHTEAAILSVTEVPKTKVIYCLDKPDKNSRQFFIGANGFLMACQHAATGQLPEIKLEEAPESLNLTLAEALKLI